MTKRKLAVIQVGFYIAMYFAIIWVLPYCYIVMVDNKTLKGFMVYEGILHLAITGCFALSVLIALFDMWCTKQIENLTQRSNCGTQTETISTETSQVDV